MRIHIDASTTETLEYLRLVNTIVRNNKEVSTDVQAFNALKELVESLDDRLNHHLESERRNKVCR